MRFAWNVNSANGASSQISSDNRLPGWPRSRHRHKRLDSPAPGGLAAILALHSIAKLHVGASQVAVDAILYPTRLGDRRPCLEIVQVERGSRSDRTAHLGHHVVA